jgi:hypothetical protein
MSAVATNNRILDSQAHALGSYRHDVAYTAALKSQTLALGSYRYDIAYTGALKSVQHVSGLAAACLESSIECQRTGVDLTSAPVLFCSELEVIAA